MREDILAWARAVAHHPMTCGVLLTMLAAWVRWRMGNERAEGLRAFALQFASSALVSVIAASWAAASGYGSAASVGITTFAAFVGRDLLTIAVILMRMFADDPKSALDLLQRFGAALFMRGGK